MGSGPNFFFSSFQNLSTCFFFFLLTLLLAALKKKHSKNDDDTKFLGTVLGKPHEQGDVVIEGGKFTSITAWEAHMKAVNERPVLEKPQINGGGGGEDSRPASSRLSTLSSMADDVEMEIDG